MADAGQFAYRDPEVANAYGPPSSVLDDAVADADAKIISRGRLDRMDVQNRRGTQDGGT